MRVFVMFDLPIQTLSERRAYSKFRKHLVKTGFVMMQESIYTKLCLNATAARVVCDNVRKNLPEKGLVELMTVTEKQYAAIEYLVGASSCEYITSTDSLVVL